MHIIIRIIVILILLAVSSSAQTYNPFNQRDDTYPLLGLKRAQEAYETARTDYERQQELYKDGLINRSQLEQARNQFVDAEVNYQQSLLAVMFEEQYVTVTKAVKYQAADGSKKVKLTIANTAGGSEEYRKLVNMQDSLFRALQPDVISNVYVSLLNENNAIISEPYEAKVLQLRYGEPRVIDFKLLQDQDAVTVSIIYGNGSQRSMRIFLQKDSSEDKVLVQSEQFSQEVELGSSASFDLTLELFSGTSNTFAMEVVNLPREIGRFFKETAGSVRLSQLKFTESNRTKRAAFEIQLPDRPSEHVLVDDPITFYVLVLPREQARKFGNRLDQQWSEDEILALNVGFVRLEVLPRGTGKIQVALPQMYHAIDVSDEANIRADILNEGSDRIDNLEVRLDLPLNWTRTIVPEEIASLDIGKEQTLHMTITPPEDVAPGKYEVRMRTSGISNGQPITTEDKSITIEIRPETNLLGTLSIVILLLSLVTGIVVYGVKLSRR
ncbi:MAG: NEW3 domain-containing protein [bacterium]|nr:NEW3 domain-containing protein [bacterium]